MPVPHHVGRPPIRYWEAKELETSRKVLKPDQKYRCRDIGEAANLGVCFSTLEIFCTSHLRALCLPFCIAPSDPFLQIGVISQPLMTPPCYLPLTLLTLIPWDILSAWNLH